MLGVYKTLCTLLNMRVLLLSKLVAFRSVTKISSCRSCRVNGISSRRETGQLFSFFLSFFLSFSLLFCWGGGGGVFFFLPSFFFVWGGGGWVYVLCSPLEVDGDVAYSGFHIHACMHLQRNSTRERSPMDKKIWYSIHPRNLVVTSAYDRTLTVQTLAEEEGRQESVRGGGEGGIIIQLRWEISHFKHPARFRGKSHGRPDLTSFSFHWI